MFLSIPLELRLIVYDYYLSEHLQIYANQQPSNAHIRLLHTCKQICHEATDLAGYKHYVSLRSERQIVAFIQNVSDHEAAHIYSIDVANDGRMVEDPGRTQSLPVSHLYLAMRKLVCLRTLRVFDCHRPRSIRDFIPGARFSLAFETAMFYTCDANLNLLSYQLYLSPTTRNVIFESVAPDQIQRLRLSGSSRFGLPPRLSALRHLTINGVTGNFFDRTAPSFFPGLHLESFVYAHGDRLGFELQDHFLVSLTSGRPSQLTKLVLLGCDRLSSDTLGLCLRNVPKLEYFALSFITVHELRSNFMTSLPASVSVLKLKITNIWYATPRTQEEEELCYTIQERVLLRLPPPRMVCLDFRDELMHGSGRNQHWVAIARSAQFSLKLGTWEAMEVA